MSLSWPAARDLFDQQLAIQKRSPETIRAYRSDLDQIAGLIAEPLGRAPADLEVTDLTGPRLREAFALFAATRAAASVARARSCWAALLDLLVADGRRKPRLIA